MEYVIKISYKKTEGIYRWGLGRSLPGKADYRAILAKINNNNDSLCILLIGKEQPYFGDFGNFWLESGSVANIAINHVDY